VAGDDGVDEAVLEHEFGGLETGGQILVSRFFHHPRTGESDHAFRLGEIDISDGGEGCGDATGCRMGEQGNVGQFRFGKPGEGAAGFRHLHERKHAFLHARAGGCGNDDDAAFFLNRGFDGAGDFFTDDGTHGTGEEFEIHHGDHRRLVVDREATGDDGVVETGFFAEDGGLFGVTLEIERVGGNEADFRFLKAVRVREQGDAIAGVHQEVMAAMIANVVVLLELKRVDHRVTVRTFDPETFRHVIAAVVGAEAGFAENAHEGKRFGRAGSGDSGAVAATVKPPSA